MKQVLVLMCVTLGLPAFGQDTETGRQHFEEYCAMCHGSGARGDGPMSGVLHLPPTDLTLLASEHEGQFPIQDVIAKIDGRVSLYAHGSDMPIYGSFFEGKGVVIRDENNAPIMTSQPIIDIVTWLISLQN